MMSDDVHDPDELSELERALVSQLRRRSQQAPVQAVSRGGVETRVAERAATRRRHRSVARGGLAAASIAALGVLAVLAAPGPGQGSTVVSDVSTIPPPTTLSVPPTTAPPAAATDLPHFGLDAPGWAPTYAASDASEGTGPIEGSTDSVQVYRDPSRSLAGPFLHVNVVPSQFYGLGEFPDAEQIELPGRTARLIERPSGLLRLGWEEPDGTIVDIEAFGVDRDELIEVARAMGPVVPPDGARRWELPVLPAGMELAEVAVLGTVVETGSFGGVMPIISSSYDTLAYEAPGGRLEFHVMAGPEPFQTQVADRLDSAVSIEALTVRGRPGVLIDVGPTGDGKRYWVLWEESDAVTAEIDVTVDSEQAVRSLLPDIVELDDAAWQNLLDRFSVPTPSIQDLPMPAPEPEVPAGR